MAQEIGISKSTLHDYLSGAIPSADRAFAIARVLDVSPAWLVTGSKSSDFQGDEWVLLTFYDLQRSIYPRDLRVLGEVPMRRDWLTQLAGSIDQLWVSIMPASRMAEVARPGDPILCQSVQSLEDGGVYIFAGPSQPFVRPWVRRVSYSSAGLVLREGRDWPDATELGEMEQEDLIPLGRIVAAFHRIP